MDASLDSILDSIAPPKTAKVYNSTWEKFLQVSGVTDVNELKEDHFLRYFFNLKSNGIKASTLWTTYSILNNTFQRKTGRKLQVMYPRLTMQLKAYQRGYERKIAKTFTIHEFRAFMQADVTSPYWLLRKAFAAIAWCGGLTCDELHRLTISSLTSTEYGFEVRYNHAKQFSEVKENSFVVPFNRNDRACRRDSLRVVRNSGGCLPPLNSRMHRRIPSTLVNYS